MSLHDQASSPCIGPADPLPTASSPTPSSLTARRLALAHAMQCTRTRINAVLGKRMLSDPYYEMLLELYIAHHERRQVSVSVSDMALAVDVPRTTELRKLEKLEAESLVRRVADRSDGRRFWVSPTAKVLQDFDLLLDQFDAALAKLQSLPNAFSYP